MLPAELGGMWQTKKVFKKLQILMDTCVCLCMLKCHRCQYNQTYFIVLVS